MALINQIGPILEHIRNTKPTLDHNENLFRINEGDLLSQVLNDLQNQLSQDAFKQIKSRVAPINILNKVLSKLSKLYSEEPTRKVVGGTQTDSDLLSFYESETSINNVMSVGNRFFNLFKNTAVEPYLDHGMPKVRIIPSDRFTVWSDDQLDPTRPTVFIKSMGTFKKETVGVNGGTTVQDKELFFIYSDEEFLAVDSDGDISREFMERANNPDGINPFGRIPFVYINRSLFDLIPTIDTDTLTMVKLIPILISDLNFASLFLSHSVIYGVDVDIENIEKSPNSMWLFKSDKTSDKKPELGVLSPTVDIDKVLKLIESQLSVWLQSRNIRPGSIGTMTTENMASGISKMIEESDTTQDRKEQVPFFVKAEKDLWDLIMHHMHPVWVQRGLIDERRLFTKNSEVSIQFKEQKPIVSRTEVLDEALKELAASLIDRKTALKRLNPDFDQDAIDELMESIETDRTITIESNQVPEDNVQPQDNVEPKDEVEQL